MTLDVLGYGISASALIAVLALVSGLITEVVKNIPGITNIPTQLFSWIPALVTTYGALIIYLSYSKATFEVYYFIGAFFASFIIWKISNEGFDSLKELWDRVYFK